MKNMLPVRIESIYNRGHEVGIDPVTVAKKIASFPNVETFQAWKNRMNENNPLAYVIERVGGNNYRYLRQLIHQVQRLWS